MRASGICQRANIRLPVATRNPVMNPVIHLKYGVQVNAGRFGGRLNLVLHVTRIPEP
jgi:hypothetical protein